MRPKPPPRRLTASWRCDGRRPEGPAALARGNRRMASLNRCPHRESSSVGGGICVSSWVGRVSRAGGRPCGCRARSFSMTTGFVGSCEPREVSRSNALREAPSPTRVRARRSVASGMVLPDDDDRARFAARVSGREDPSEVSRCRSYQSERMPPAWKVLMRFCKVAVTVSRECRPVTLGARRASLGKLRRANKWPRVGCWT